MLGIYCQAASCQDIGMLSKLFGNDSIGLYRGDGLSIFRNYNGHQSDKVRKDLTKLFKKYQLNLDIKPQKCRLFRHIIRLEQRYLQTFQQTQ